MSTYTATIYWTRSGANFSKNEYSRAHVWELDGGIRIPASSSPKIVPLPWSAEAAIDPEEAFVASLSSCHMLWFLSIARKHGFVVESYWDQAEGILMENEEGKLAMTRVVLRPEVLFQGPAPELDTLGRLHHEAHEACFIANSVKSLVQCEPVPSQRIT